MSNVLSFLLSKTPWVPILTAGHVTIIQVKQASNRVFIRVFVVHADVCMVLNKTDFLVGIKKKVVSLGEGMRGYKNNNKHQHLHLPFL